MSKQFDGLVEIRDAAKVTTISLDPDASRIDIALGGGVMVARLGASSTDNGELVIRDKNGKDAILLSAGDRNIVIRQPDGTPVIELGKNGNLYAGGGGTDGDVVLRDTNGKDAIHLDAAARNILIRQPDGTAVIQLGINGNLYAGGGGADGDVVLRDKDGKDTVQLGADEARVLIGRKGKAGKLVIRDYLGLDVFRLESPFGAHGFIGTEGLGGFLHVIAGDGTEGVLIDGSGTITCAGDIQLTGSDLAEEFGSAAAVEPGSVLVALGQDEVAPAVQAHDRRVIGVASGAGDLRPALRLGTRPGEGRVPVAVVGRVHCKVDAGYGAIATGDLLTTSQTPGHAMRVTDVSAAAGATLGKALATLDRGRGLVPVLLSLG